MFVNLYRWKIYSWYTNIIIPSEKKNETNLYLLINIKDYHYNILSNNKMGLLILLLDLGTMREPPANISYS